MAASVLLRTVEPLEPWCTPTADMNEPPRFPLNMFSVTSSASNDRPHNRNGDAPQGQRSTNRLPSISNLLGGTVQSQLTLPPLPPDLDPLLPKNPDLAQVSSILSPSLSSNTARGSRLCPVEDHQRPSAPLFSAPAGSSPMSPGAGMWRDNTRGVDTHERLHGSLGSPHMPVSNHSVNPSASLSWPQTPLHNLGPTYISKNVVYEDLVPGKGMCYIYNDGSICQKVINGDTVNPKWGTTKAGKPRKRLGQACNSCREKKIKCDPSYPRCLQCQKINRECIFESPTRIQKSPRVRAAEARPPLISSTKEQEIRAPSAAPSDSSYRSDLTQDSVSLPKPSPHSSHSNSITLDEPSRLEFMPANKRIKHTWDSSVPDAAISQDGDQKFTTVHSYQRVGFDFSLKINPFDVNPTLTRAVLKSFCSNFAETSVSAVPEPLLKRWVESAEYKSEEAILILYCILAVGSLFYRGPDKGKLRRMFSEIAMEGIAEMAGRFSIQLMEARLYLALYESYIGHSDKAWELCGAALRAAYAMKLNTEDGIAGACRRVAPPYDLSASQFVEYVRRLVWLAFLIDRYHVASTGYVNSFGTEDLLLNLPCTDKAYETSHIPPTSTLADEQFEHVNHSNPVHLGSLAYLVRIVALIADARSLSNRASYSMSSDRSTQFQDSWVTLQRRFDHWERTYSRSLPKSEPSETLRWIDNSSTLAPVEITAKNSSKVGGLHLWYHFGCMLLHRYVQHQNLSHDRLLDHVQRAYHHACKALELAKQLNSKENIHMADAKLITRGPITAFAIMMAIDIITAAGLTAELLDHDGRLMSLAMYGVGLFDTLAESWATTRKLRDLVANRIKVLYSAIRTAANAGKTAFYSSDCMSDFLGPEHDVVYGIDRLQYFDLMGWTPRIRGRTEIARIETPKMTLQTEAIH